MYGVRLTLLAVGALVLIAIGALLMVVCFQILDTLSVTNYMVQLLRDPAGRALIGVIGVLLTLVGAVQLSAFTLIGEPPARAITFTNEEGTVSFAVKAVEHFVCEVCSTVPEADDLTAKVKQHPEGLVVNIGAALNLAESRVPDISLKLQQLVKEQLNNVLGILNVKSVNISLESRLTPPQIHGAADNKPETHS